MSPSYKNKKYLREHHRLSHQQIDNWLGENRNRNLKYIEFKSDQKHNRHLFKNQIEVNNITFGYEPGNNIFEKFNETIPATKIIGIVGESGCGKTTLIDLIDGLHTPLGGTITIDSAPLTSDLLPEWKNKIGYLPQDPFL